jgi:hypothetical protein
MLDRPKWDSGKSYQTAFFDSPFTATKAICEQLGFHRLRFGRKGRRDCQFDQQACELLA